MWQSILVGANEDIMQDWNSGFEDLDWNILLGFVKGMAALANKGDSGIDHQSEFDPIYEIYIYPLIDFQLLQYQLLLKSP